MTTATHPDIYAKYKEHSGCEWCGEPDNLKRATVRGRKPYHNEYQTLTLCAACLKDIRGLYRRARSE